MRGLDNRVVVRTTVPPAQPAVDLAAATVSPVARAKAAEEEVPAIPANRPGYLPEYNPGSWVTGVR